MSADTAVGLLVAMLLVLAINIGVLAVTVKLYTEILKDKKFDIREVRTGQGVAGTVRPARREP